MTREEDSSPKTSLSSRMHPHAGVGVQLFAAATMWLIGASILLFRGMTYVSDRSWHSWALGAGLALGVLKARYLLDRVAGKAVDRILKRGKAFFFGFFSLRSWVLIAVMMGGGITLRRVFVHPGRIGAGVIGAIYIGVGVALLAADRVFWHEFISCYFPHIPVPLGKRR